MIVRREGSADLAAVREVTVAAFGRAYEAELLDDLRASDEWLPALSLVAVDEDVVVGHLVCSRAWIADRPVVALGPVSVTPSRHRTGVGKAMMHTVLGAAEALREPVVVLLGHADYYPQFGFVPAESLGIVPPVPEWSAHFQARPLADYDPTLRGSFRYAPPFG